MKIVPLLLATLLASGGCIGISRPDATLCQRLLLKTGTGSQTCALRGCVTCDDYCGKCVPCTPCVEPGCESCYCEKCLPCTPCVPCCECPCYCEKTCPCIVPVSCAHPRCSGCEKCQPKCERCRH